MPPTNPAQFNLYVPQQPVQQPVKPSMKFFQGRVARLNYLAATLANAVLGGLLYAIINILLLFGFGPQTMQTIAPIVFILIIIVVMFLSITLVVRRFHDLGFSGWWTLVNLIPVVNIVSGLILLFKKGKQIENAYGPVPPTKVDDIMGVIFARVRHTTPQATMSTTVAPPPSTTAT